MIPAIPPELAALLDAEAPEVAEGIVEDGAIVARLARGDRLGPCPAIRGGLQKVTRLAAIREQLEAGILRGEIEPQAVVATRIVAFGEEEIVFKQAEVRPRPGLQIRARREGQRSRQPAV